MTFTEYYKTHKDGIDGIFFDMDGTLAVGRTPLPGAKELLTLLEEERFPYLLLTNDACHSCAEKAARVQSAGLPVTEERIYSSGNVLSLWAKENYHGELYFQCGNLGKPNFADLAGIRTTRDPDRTDECAGFLMGEGFYDWQPAMEAVLNTLLHHPEKPMIVPNPDSYWASGKNNGIGVGSGGQARFIAGILKEAGVTVEPVYLGKPYGPVYDGAFEKFRGQYPDRQIRRERIMMVGDSLASDILGGNRNGLCSCLVLSGITTLELAEKAPAEKKPRLIFGTV